MVSERHTIVMFLSLVLFLPAMMSSAVAQAPEGARATTELSCSFSMEKDETAEPCHVPFPKGCLVAKIPGTTQPWTSISKGGRLQCRFDEKKTDWKTNIVGTCGRCQSVRCSAQFSVRFDCSGQP
ncbi:MAG: hypothetical protein MRJ66_10045 [Nitrospira sp.]|nr:hypothetical protein [Nitrospira sp.]MDR4469631.1 hypothetical protein [Nitrospira sp.]